MTDKRKEFRSTLFVLDIVLGKVVKNKTSINVTKILTADPAERG